jgi:hypothetical protein
MMMMMMMMSIYGASSSYSSCKQGSLTALPWRIISIIITTIVVAVVKAHSHQYYHHLSSWRGVITGILMVYHHSISIITAHSHTSASEYSIIAL